MPGDEPKIEEVDEETRFDVMLKPMSAQSPRLELLRKVIASGTAGTRVAKFSAEP